jgi:predicted transcriptional regulator
MKTTLNLSDDLLESAKELAKSEKTTLTEIIELSLRSFLSKQTNHKKIIKWKKCHFGNGGLVEGLKNKPWSEIRDISYKASK